MHAEKWNLEKQKEKKMKSCCIRRGRPLHISLRSFKTRYDEFGCLNVLQRIVYKGMRVMFLAIWFYYLPLLFAVWANLKPILTYWESFDKCIGYADNNQ